MLTGLAGPARAACTDAPAAALLEVETRLALPATAPRTVALTLDACSGATDMRILEVLLGLGIPATIFATSRWIGRNPAALATLRAHPALFSVQNHGARHIPAILGSGRVYGVAVAGTLEAVRQEVAGGAAAIVAAGFPAPRWYRGATALYSPAAIVAIEAMGYAIAGFSLSGDEGASLPAPSVARRIGAARSGDIVIAHVNHPERGSGAGVAAAIEALHRSGTVFTRLDRAATTAPSCHPHGGAARMEPPRA